MKMSRQQLWLVLAVTLLALTAGVAGDRGGREKRTLDLLLRGLAQALGYEVRPIKGRGVIPATDPPPRSAVAGGAPSGAQKDRETTTPSLPEPVTDPRVRPPYDVDDLLSYRGQHQQRQQGGTSPPAGPATPPAPPTTPASAGPTPPPENCAISQFVRANAGSLLNAEFDRTQLGRGPGGIRCKEEHALPELPHYPGYDGPDFDSGPHLDFQKGQEQQREPDHSTESGGSPPLDQHSQSPGEHRQQPQDVSYTGQSYGGPGSQKVPTTGGQVEGEVPQVPDYSSEGGGSKQPLENFADILFGPLEPQQKQPNQQGQSAHSESDQNQPASGGPDGGYFGVVLGAPLQYRPPPSEQQIVSRQNRHQAEREQEEVNHQGAYVGVIVQAPLHHGGQHHHQGGQPDQQHHHQAGPPEQAHGTQLQQQVHHRGPNSEHLFNQWASASPTVYPSLQPYIFSYTVPAWVSVSRRSDEAGEVPAQTHLSLLEEPLHATGRYFPQGAGGSSEPRGHFREEDLPEPLRLHRAEEEQEEEEEEEAVEEEEGEGQQEAEEQDYDEEAEQQDDTPTSPPPPRPPSPPPVPEAPRQRGPHASAAPGGSAPPPAAGSLLQQLPLPLPPASTHAPPMLQLLQQRQQPPPRGAGGGSDPGAGLPLGVGVGALWPPPPFDSAAAALASNNNDLLAATEKRAAQLGKNSWGPQHHAPALWASSQLAVSPTLAAPRGVPSAQFPVHYSSAPLADYGAGLSTPPASGDGRLLAAPKASAAAVTLKAAPTSALELELELPWNFYTDPANHRHNFAFSSAGEQQPNAPGAAAAASSTPATWAVLDGPTKVYKRHAVAARSWAFHEDFVVLSDGDDDDDDSDSDGAHSQPAGARRAAPMTHSESFGSLWRDFVTRLSDDGDEDDVEVAGSEESGAVSRPTRSGGQHFPTYHRDPLGYVSKYVPEDDDDAGFVGASSVLRTRVAEGRSEKLEETQPTPARADSKVEAVTWPSFNDPVLYGEALEKRQQQQQQGQEQNSVQEGGQSGSTGTEYSSDGPKPPPEQAGEDRGREVSSEKQPSSSAGAPNDESGKEVEAGDGASKPDEGDAKREEFVPYFARPEHYRIRYQEPEEEGGASGVSDQEQGSSQESGMSAAHRKKPWYFKDPGARYGGTRRREHQQEGAAHQHRPQPQNHHQNHHQNHRHQPKHRGQQSQKQARAEPDVWDYYGNPDNFYIPPDTISTIVIGKEEEEGEDQGKGAADPPTAAPAPARERPSKNSRRRPAGRNSRESDWPPAGFRSSTHHSRGSKGQAAGPKAESTSTEHRSPHFAHENPYHSEYEYPKIEYTAQSASAADSGSAAGASEDTYPWSLYTGSASHFFGSQKKKAPENAGETAGTEPPPKGTAVNSGKVTVKESAKDEGKAASKPATRGPDPLWHLAMRVLAHANAAGKAKAATPSAKPEASTVQDTSKNAVLTKGGSPSTSSASQPAAGDSNRGGTSANISPTNEYSWFSADTTFPSYEASRSSSVTNPAATASSAAGRKQEDAATVGAGDDHWTQYTSPFSHNADTGVDAGSGSSPWRPESFFQQPAGLDYGRTGHAGPPSSQQHQADPRQTPPPPQQQVSRTTTTSQTERETSAGALLGLFLPRILLPTSPPAAVAAAAAAPTAQEVLEAVRPQVRISVAPSAAGGVATVAAVEPVRYEFSTETTLLAPFSTGGLSKETVSRTSTLHLTGHFQVNPDDRGDADAPTRPKSRIAAASAI